MSHDLTFLPIRVKERNEPTLVFLLSSKNPAGEITPYPSLGKTYEMFIKRRHKDADPPPLVGVHVMEQDTSTETAVLVELPADRLVQPGPLVYHLDAVEPRETVAWGPLIVVDL